MQSSPPVRASERPPSPGGSQYSLDLGALDLESYSSETSPMPKQHMDRVVSEDIDGPSDFTVNLEKWMRGGTLQKGTMRSAQSALLSLKEQVPAPEHEEVGLARDVPTSPQREDLPLDETTESRRTSSSSPPRESILADRMQKQVREHLSSEWDPYGEASTPQPPMHNQFLQPMVEDYHSELTPAGLPSTQLPALLSTARGRPAVEAQAGTKREPSPPGRPSSPTLSPVRPPVLRRSMTAPKSQETEVEFQLQQLQARCQQLERLNSALKYALEEEQRVRGQEKRVQQMHIAEAARRERDLTQMKEEGCKRAEDFRTEFAAQKQELHSFETEAAENQKKMQRLKEEHMREMQSLHEQMQHQNAKQHQKLRALNHDLEQAHRSRDDAEEAARLHREELEEYRDGHDAEMHRLRLVLQQDEDSTARTIKLEEQLRAADTEKANLKIKIAEVKQAQIEETTRLSNDHRRAAELAEDLQKKLKELQELLRDRQAAHDAEIERLQNADNGASTEVAELRTDLEAKQSMLNDAVLDRDAAQDSLTSLQSEIEALRIRHDGAEAVNNAFDARISGAMRRREVYWRSRLEESEREQQLMAKALLHQWGREEVGVDSPQGYEYKYLVRS